MNICAYFCFKLFLLISDFFQQISAEVYEKHSNNVIIVHRLLSAAWKKSISYKKKSNSILQLQTKIFLKMEHLIWIPQYII